MKTNIGISEKNTKAIAALLNIVLADETVLYTKTRNFHWNVTGSSFMEMHKLFEGQYDAIAVTIDEVAERIRSLAQTPAGSLKEYLALTSLKESSGTVKAKEMVEILLADHEAIIRNLREAIQKIQTIGDDGTVDFLIGMLQDHEKTAWMLRVYLQ